jgi:GH24 family phage-related lysozyme (muramidase)
VVAHDCNRSTQEAEARGLWVLGQPRLHRETLSQKIKQRKPRGSVGVVAWTRMAAGDKESWTDEGHFLHRGGTDFAHGKWGGSG